MKCSVTVMNEMIDDREKQKKDGGDWRTEQVGWFVSHGNERFYREPMRSCLYAIVFTTPIEVGFIIFFWLAIAPFCTHCRPHVTLFVGGR
ncbi:hypothetical protein VNO78_23465 [Psophocarpus tetragonolobus]|uniref:Uncharacterized protein n=1 Tax=Psophocarpus tetragonolobus TaxID=3891 RepID=A0AAN9S3L5_PSOTE